MYYAVADYFSADSWELVFRKLFGFTLHSLSDMSMTSISIVFTESWRVHTTAMTSNTRTSILLWKTLAYPLAFQQTDTQTWTLIHNVTFSADSSLKLVKIHFITKLISSAVPAVIRRFTIAIDFRTFKGIQLNEYWRNKCCHDCQYREMEFWHKTRWTVYVICQRHLINCYHNLSFRSPISSLLCVLVGLVMLIRLNRLRILWLTTVST